MKKGILVKGEDCGACHLCEAVCALVKAGECNPSKARIQIWRGEMKETPVLCQQCEVLFCAAACPQGAITRDPESGVVLVAEERCDGCRTCLAACPYHAVAFDRERKKALICDQCGGRPECVAWCPREALVYVELTDAQRAAKAEASGRIFSLVRQIGR